MWQSSQRLGATYLGEQRCRFLVWAPKVERLEVHLLAPHDRLVELQRGPDGYFTGELTDVPPGARYFYRLDGNLERPDPCSRLQPEGVHGPSEVVHLDFPWTDQSWRGLPLQDYIFYELHVGTFSAPGTFEGVIGQLDRLVDLGINAIELLPVAQFPGTRNWGYDGAALFAVQQSYGGPQGLCALVDACHARNLAVVLDVVYNHLGPEGNYLHDFGYYFTDRYRTPWGGALNFDDHHSDAVRQFFLENALYWIHDLHLDGLRLDAVHAIFDESARPFLRELNQTVQEEALRLNRHVHLVAESNKNDIRHVQPVELGGYGLQGQWNDDFHHALHALLTGEHNGYYADFSGLRPLAKAYREGFVYTGQRSRYRGRRHGVSSRNIPPECFVVYSQNHDQVGNRLAGDRLSTILTYEQLKLAAATVLLSPYVPMLFMGEEYGEPAPFFYFVSHSDQELAEAVRRGRMREFARFQWQGTIPDPQAESTFERSRIRPERMEEEIHQVLWQWYRELIRLRKTHPAFQPPAQGRFEVQADEARHVLIVHRWSDESRVVLLHHFGSEPVQLELELEPGTWHSLLDSMATVWRGKGPGLPSHIRTEPGMIPNAHLTLAPWSVAVLEMRR